MNPDRDIRADLGPDVPEALLRVAERLERERPVPRAAFRGELGRRFARADARPRPARLRTLIAGCASAGFTLLLIGAASAAGWGPLAA
jgi:hypothetical protein